MINLQCLWSKYMEPDQAQACQYRSLSEIQSVQATITMRKINRSLKLWVYQVILKFPECTNTCSGLAGWVIGWPEAGQLPVQWWGTEIHILLDPDKYIFIIFLLTANLGIVLVIFLYSIHRAICRPSDHSVVRPQAEIRTRDGRI